MTDLELKYKLYNYGVRIGKIWGKELIAMFENVKIPDQPVTIILPVEKLATYKHFTRPTRIMMASTRLVMSYNKFDALRKDPKGFWLFQDKPF